MEPRKARLGFLLAAGAIVLALLAPSGPRSPSLLPSPAIWQTTAGAGLLFLCAAWMADARATAFGLAGMALAGGATLAMLRDPAIAGSAGTGFWMIVIAVWLAAALCVVNLAAMRPLRTDRQNILNILVPLLFGAVVFYLWEVGVRGFGVPPVLLPSPSAAAVKFASSLPTLGADFVQTFVRGVLIGYAIGCGAGLLVAILAHRYAFLGRGLLPLGNFFSALPLVGIAPIMVMWFGFDWPSKAAVVALVTFFPMLVNALAGLSASGHIERDLMRSYAANHSQSLSKLYLPAAMPFIFNALKINATLALIGAIVAEFFGTPTQGIGFRISTEAGRMAIDMVWAEIALAALAGMGFYGLVALAERATTFWHPSYRTRLGKVS
jgi:NitT/TauT family transport system permease protein